jgi:hypothetical protein
MTEGWGGSYDSGNDLGANPGSREPSPSGLGPSGFDPERMAAELLPRLGRAQRRVISSLTEEWGEAACHKTAKRMFYGVAGQHRPVVFHKHRTDNCWRLSDLGMALKAAIAMEARRAETGTGSVHDSAAIAQGDEA